MRASESPYRNIEVIPTGFGNLDIILGLGGIPLRKITEVSGKFSVGKSTLALSIIASAQKMGLDTCWVDTEFSFDEKYAASLGVDLDSLELINEHYGEDALDGAERWVDGTKRGFMVLDSIGGLLPRQEAEKGADGKVIGAQAKMVSTFCRKIVPLLAINNVGLLVLNHEFTDLMSGRLMTPGGFKLGHHKSIWLRLSHAGKNLKKGEEYVGEIIKAEIRKNKLAPTMKKTTELTMLYGQGFQRGADLMEQAKEKLLTKKGQFWYLGEEKVARGENGLRELFRDESFTAKMKSLLA